MASIRRGKRSRQPADEPQPEPQRQMQRQRQRQDDDLDGVQYQGKWYCNCEPRRQAEIFKVRKNGSTKGQLFYKCPERNCDFWLWETDARKRPESTLRPEEAEQQLVTPKKTQPKLDGWLTNASGRRQAQDGATAEDDAAAAETPCPPTSKRKRDAFEAADDDEEFLYGVGSEEEQELIALVDQTSAKKAKRMGKAPQARQQSPQLRARSQPGSASTKSDAAADQDPYKTPSAQRTVDVVGGLPTPSVTRTLFPSSSSKRHKTVSFEERPEEQTPSSCVTTTATIAAPSPVSASQPSTPATPSSKIVDVAEEVMPLLAGQGIAPDVLESVRRTLISSSNQARAVVANREFLRSELRKKDTDKARLQEKMAAVENRNMLRNRQSTNIKAGLMKLHDDISNQRGLDKNDIKKRLMKLYQDN